MKSIYRLLGLLLASVYLASPVSAATAGNGISVENPYARAVPPTARNSGAFMRIRNDSNRDIKLISARSDVSEVTELHNHIHDNGVMRMRRVDAIPVPAHGSVELKPGSYHVMLINLKKALKPEDPVHIDLTFDDGSVLPVDLTARMVGIGKGAKGRMQGMGGKCGSGKCGGMK